MHLNINKNGETAVWLWGISSIPHYHHHRHRRNIEHMKKDDTGYLCMRLVRAREKKKTKKNESMNVHGWNLFGCVCCKFSFKSYKLVEKNTQSENCQRVIKTNFLTGCCFCDINARENKVTFSLYFLFLKTVTVETFEFTPSESAGAQKSNANAKRECKKEKKRLMWLC